MQRTVMTVFNFQSLLSISYKHACANLFLSHREQSRHGRQRSRVLLYSLIFYMYGSSMTLRHVGDILPDFTLGSMSVICVFTCIVVVQSNLQLKGGSKQTVICIMYSLDQCTFVRFVLSRYSQGGRKRFA